MHEFTIASLIVDSLLDLARKQGSTRVLDVYLKIGELRSISTEQVMFSYGVLTRGTMLEGSRLIIEEVPANVRCSKCGYDEKFHSDDTLSFHFAPPALVCPRCGGALSIDGGDECVISRVKMELAEKQAAEQRAAR